MRNILSFSLPHLHVLHTIFSVQESCFDGKFFINLRKTVRVIAEILFVLTLIPFYHKKRGKKFPSLNKSESEKPSILQFDRVTRKT